MPKMASESEITLPLSRRVIRALDNELRLQILMILTQGSLSVHQVFMELIRRNSEVRYRETVYKALEILVRAGVVLKASNGNGFLYRLSTDRLTVRFTDMEPKVIRKAECDLFESSQTKQNPPEPKEKAQKVNISF